ncbi:hypothetical protein JTB14_013175 [Gonioctena quinquepunctata]|nr:hypothetical protein JTB14_013175 [Gonioctena quinquepunctata]
MVYGLLNVKIREKVPKDQVTTFTDLLSRARLADETFVDSDRDAFFAKTLAIQKTNVENDLIILSSTYDQHLDDLTLIFARLRQFQLRANREKCVFVCASVRYLGHLLTPTGIEVDLEKTAAIANQAAFRDSKGVQSFLQACSWYRRFIENFAEISRPLSELMRKIVAWNWTERHQESFETLKSLLMTAPILQQADEGKPFSIRTDASSFALGAVLVQGEGAEEHPVEYASRLLTKPEQNYSTTEREALAVVWALDKFRGYIEGSEVTLSTDHQPLRWLLNIKSPTGRLARWALRIQSYNLKIEYLPGKRNVIADFLSRPPCGHENDSTCDICLVSIEMPCRSAGEIRAEQLKDPEVLKIIKSFEDPNDETITQWTNRGYIMSSGVLYKYSWDEESEVVQLVVPAHERTRGMQEHHDSPTAAHYGVERTYARIAKKYNFTAVTWREARGIHDEQQDRHKKYADRKHGKVAPYAEGDQVWVTTHTQSSSTKRTTKKFDPKRDGPYVITKVISPVSYQVAAPDSIEEPLGVYHVSALLPYQGPAEQEPVVPIRKRGRPRKKKT